MCPSADRAKQIKTTATVNEDPTAALIRELQEENERLKKMMESGNMTVIKGDDEEDDDMSEEGRWWYRARHWQTHLYNNVEEISTLFEKIMDLTNYI